MNPIQVNVTIDIPQLAGLLAVAQQQAVKASTGEAPHAAAEAAPAETVEQKEKRTRRTKAEMEAARAAEAQVAQPKKAAEVVAEAKPETAAPAVTEGDLKTLFDEYLQTASNEDAREERKNNLREVMRALGAARRVDIPADKRDETATTVKMLIDKANKKAAGNDDF